jgi:hypothetical protein
MIFAILLLVLVVSVFTKRRQNGGIAYDPIAGNQSTLSQNQIVNNITNDGIGGDTGFINLSTGYTGPHSPPVSGPFERITEPCTSWDCNS